MKSCPVFCPNCSSRVCAENINVHELVGKCEDCHQLFGLNLTRIPAATERLGAGPSRPSGVSISRGGHDDLLIVRRWFEPGLIGLLVFCIFWDGFWVFWYSMALSGVNGKELEWMPILVPILHVAVGVWLTYFVIAGFLNETIIYLDWEMLSVRHGPVPWYGNRDLLLEEIHGVEIDHAYSSYSSSEQPGYSVSAQINEGQQIDLLSGLKLKQAQYIAWQIANYLSVPLSDCKPASKSVHGVAIPSGDRGDFSD